MKIVPIKCSTSNAIMHHSGNNKLSPLPKVHYTRFPVTSPADGEVPAGKLPTI